MSFPRLQAGWIVKNVEPLVDGLVKRRVKGQGRRVKGQGAMPDVIVSLRCGLDRYETLWFLTWIAIYGIKEIIPAIRRGESEQEVCEKRPVAVD